MLSDIEYSLYCQGQEGFCFVIHLAAFSPRRYHLPPLVCLFKLEFWLLLRSLLCCSLPECVQARFLKAEKSVKELGASVNLMKMESKKLLERAALAESDMKHGLTDLT